LLRRRRPRERPAAGEPCDRGRPPHSGVRSRRVPEWSALFARLWTEARRGTVLALDEFPALVAVAPEVPSLLQKHLDRDARRGVHLLLAGSSQRMMQGLVLERTAPLYGRAAEIMKVGPLGGGWIAKALRLTDPARAVEGYAVW